jgi:hypothetical protein
VWLAPGGRTGATSAALSRVLRWDGRQAALTPDPATASARQSVSVDRRNRKLKYGRPRSPPSSFGAVAYTRELPQRNPQAHSVFKLGGCACVRVTGTMWSGRYSRLLDPVRTLPPRCSGPPQLARAWSTPCRCQPRPGLTRYPQSAQGSVRLALRRPLRRRL